MDAQKLKVGRLRRYDLQPPAGYASAELAHSAAMLQELAERVYDQISDLPGEALDFDPGDTKLTIARLVLHMAWAEAIWVKRLTGAEIPPALAGKMKAGNLDRFDEEPGGGLEAAELIDLCRRMQKEYTEPALADVADIDSPLDRGERKVSVRGVMGQLNWHWIYHSGQVGLLRLLWGSDYQWRSGDIVATPPR